MILYDGSAPEWSSLAAGARVRSLAERYPCLRSGVFGRSGMGKPLRCLFFGEGERAAVFAAGQHANEWICSPALLNHVEALASAWAVGDAAARELYRRTRLCFAPLVNPDGADLVTGALRRGRYYERAEHIAAGFPDVSFPSGWKANISGVDLNLQYPAGWERAKEIKFALGWTRPAPRDYVGAAPLCAAEARALYLLTRRMAPKNVLTLHTQGEVIYWRYRGFAPPGAESLAEDLAAASGYALDEAPDESGSAGYKDWAIDALGIPAFTVECGLGENPLPASELGGISAAADAVCARLEAWCAAS